MRRLVDADVRLYAADQNLPRPRAPKLFLKLLSPARAESGLFDNRKRGVQDSLNLARRVAEPLRILFGDDDGDAQKLRRMSHERDARRHLGEIRDRGAKSLLHIYDDQRRLRRIERILMLHYEIPLERYLNTRGSGWSNRRARMKEKHSRTKSIPFILHPSAFILSRIEPAT